MAEQIVPDFMVQLSRALEHKPLSHPSDQLGLLGGRLSGIRWAFAHGSKSHAELLVLTDALERDLISWSEKQSLPGSSCSFRIVQDTDSPRSLHGTRHVYNTPQARSYWNHWRLVRILLSRTHEAIWRRSWPVLASPERQIPDTEHFRTIRNCMASELCIATADEIGGDPNGIPGPGSVAGGLMVVVPLVIAGTVFIEQLAEVHVSPSGRRLIHMDRPLHLDPFNSSSTQLSWIVDMIEHISQSIGIQWANTGSIFIKGESGLYYDLCRA